jgi:hypothetical protein
MAVQTQIQARRGTAATWTSTNPTLAAGETGFETDTGKFKIGTGSLAWNSLAYAGGTTAVTFLYNATAGQTTFSGADANSLTLAYTVGLEQVYLNGVLQVRGTDYTASNGTSIVLASGALVSDVLNVIAYSAMTITDTYTQAQADAKFFQNANAFVAGKNKIINGDFGVWQRGTSFTIPTATYTYTADRFVTYSTHTSGTCTVSQQTFTPGTAPVAGYEGTYFLRMGNASGASYYEISQKVEDVRTFAGQTVTVSFWAKASNATTMAFIAGQNFGTGGSAGANSTGSNFSLTTSWQRFTYTFTMPSVAGKTIGTGSFVWMYFYYGSGTVASNNIDIWGVQWEAGSIATPFQTATGTIQGELAACQRYYYRTNIGSVSYAFIGVGNAYSSSGSRFLVNYPVQMRTTPSAIDYSTLRVTDDIVYDSAVTALTLYRSNPSYGFVDATSGASMTQYRSYFLSANNSTSAYLGFTAEL